MTNDYEQHGRRADEKWSTYFLYLGLFLYLMGIRMTKLTLVTVVIGFNTAMWLNLLKYKHDWYGVDTMAYLTQAGQFILGQTNYGQISSL